MNRRGFTLTEMLIVIVLMGIVGAVLTRNMLSMQRAANDQAQRVNLQGNLRAGAAFVPTELRELNIDAASNDLLVLEASRVEYMAMRATGIACVAVDGAATITLRDRLTFGYRGIQVGRDGLFIFVDGDPNTAGDDTWATRAITASAAGTCPDGEAATVLTLDSGLPAGMTAGTPVRAYERMELSLYASGGRNWLGARSVSAGEAVQPVLGPLAANGLTFTYRTAAGAVTATAAQVRVIEVALRGETQGAVSRGYGSPDVAEDNVAARIRLRNTD